MLICLKSITLFGLKSYEVDIEIDLHRGLPSFQIVGLTDTAIQESRERVRSAIKNAGYEFPRMKVVVNLAPADLRKNGPRFDLPIALGILVATGQVRAKNLENMYFLGELSFEGSVRSVSGVLPSVMGLKNKKTTVFVPVENAEEASLVEHIDVFGVANLKALVAHLENPNNEEKQIKKTEKQPFISQLSAPDPAHDMQHIKGQDHAKRALEVAAAGGHNILMIGPPGSGKTMLAKAFHTILPPLSAPEALEITQIYSISGLTNRENPVVNKRPFRNVHHTASGVAIVGGGNPPRPGEISLSHRGVLFLDEFAEFPQKTLEVLRQPLEDGVITVSRSSGTSVFPAKFTLVAAMNPTPSGYEPEDARCTDSASSIARYQGKVSGPILDRIDLHVTVPHIAFERLSGLESGRSSQEMREKVVKAREIQEKRFKGSDCVCNADMNTPMVKQFCNLTAEAQDLLKNVVQQMELSGRAYYRMLKVARTVADLDQKDEITVIHVAEAIGYRQRVM